VDARIADLIGRPDIGASQAATQVAQDPYTGFYAGDTGGVAASAGFDTGRVSALMLAGLAAGGVLFYVWTRGHQR
jgi:hypothetical protein